MKGSAPKVLAIASAGGHFVQLLRLLPAFRGCDLTVATSLATMKIELLERASAAGLEPPDFQLVVEANRWHKLRLIKSGLSIVALILRKRPDVIVTTGAAPGYIALRVGKLVGARTVWIDSIANAEELSLSGLRAGRHADLWLTQWEHLARHEGPYFEGSVL